MTTFPFLQVDAFAERPFTGNPAAVVLLDAWPDDALLQRIAEENNLSETAFLVPDATRAADRELRWFTPTSEVAMCGHATLASGHVLLSAEPERTRATFRTRQAGILTVARADGGYALDLPAWTPEPRALPAVVAALGLPEHAVVETLWHDRRYGVVVVGHEEVVRAARPDFRALAEVGDWLTILTAPGAATDIVTRAFAPGAGIDEDPVTGSAHAVVVPYWAARLGRDTLTAWQASARGGHLGCRLAGERVILTGRCVTVIEGRFRL